jgi:hypothetical protein
MCSRSKRELRVPKYDLVPSFHVHCSFERDAGGRRTRKSPMTYLTEESLPPGTKIVVESCGSSRSGREFVHLLSSLPTAILKVSASPMPKAAAARRDGRSRSATRRAFLARDARSVLNDFERFAQQLRVYQHADKSDRPEEAFNHGWSPQSPRFIRSIKR